MADLNRCCKWVRADNTKGVTSALVVSSERPAAALGRAAIDRVVAQTLGRRPFVSVACTGKIYVLLSFSFVSCI